VRGTAAGCPLPALTPEIARADPQVREAFQSGLVAVHAQVEKMTGSKTRAWALIAECVGAVMLARALPDASHRADLLDAVARDGNQRLVAPAGAKARGQGPPPRTGRPGKEKP
jgi:hypothetical protein